MGSLNVDRAEVAPACLVDPVRRLVTFEESAPFTLERCGDLAGFDLLSERATSGLATAFPAGFSSAVLPQRSQDCRADQQNLTE